MDNHYRMQQEIKRHFHNEELENSGGYENNDSFNGNCSSRDNYSTNDNSDDECDSDEIQIDGLVSKLKSKRVKELEAQLTRDQLEEEKR